MLFSSRKIVIRRDGHIAFEGSDNKVDDGFDGAELRAETPWNETEVSSTLDVTIGTLLALRATKQSNLETD